jgi:hypothetical protein
MAPSAEYLQALEFLRTGGASVRKAPEFDLPVAGNIIEWVTDKRFLDFHQAFAHFGQYQFLRDVAQIRCPVCNPFDKDSEGPGRVWGRTRTELESEVLLVRAVNGDACPKCKGTREEFVKDKLLYDYNTAIVCVGARAGKSASAALLATYLEHVIYCTAGWERDALAKKLGQAPGTRFDVAFVAASGRQAEKTIWDWFTNFRERCPWLGRYRTKIKELQAAQPRIGQKRWEFVEIGKSIRNDLIRVELDSLHSNSATMAGATRIAAFVDELARFDTTESKRGADEVWRVLSMSLKTVRQAAINVGFPSHLFGLKIATSSPISMDDKMMSLLQKQDVLDNMFALKMATWEFNPFLPKEAFAEDYAEDPVQAERDFGANPPLTETPLIEDVPRFAKSIASKLTPAVLFRTTYPEDAFRRQYIGLEVEDTIISPESPRFITFDAGASFDSFAGAMAHPAWVEVSAEPGERQPRRILMTVYDWVIRIMPTEKPKRTVWFDSVVKIVDMLKDKFRITQVCFDRWQSEALIQDIRAFGVQAEQESITVKDFVSFKSDCYSGKVKLLPPLPFGVGGRPELEFLENGQLRYNRTPMELSPQAAGIYELVKLSRSEDLRKVYNPLKGRKRGYDSDDVAQVIVGVHRQIQAAMSDDPSKTSRKDRLRREQQGGEMWGGGSSVHVGPPTGSYVAGGNRGSRGRGTGGLGYTNQDQYVGGVSKYAPPATASGDTFVGGINENAPVPSEHEHEFSGPGLVRLRRWHR